MSETNGNAQAAVVGQTEGQAQGEQSQKQAAGEPQEPTQPQAEQTPEYVTRADAERMVQDVLNQARSYADKGRVRAEKAAQEAKQMVEKMRSYGKDISNEEADQIVAAAKQKAITEPDAEEDGQDDLAPTGQLTPAQAQELQYFAENDLGAHDLKMQGKYGIELEPSDPEVTAFKVTGDAAKDRENIEAMYQAKQKRLSNPNIQNNNVEATDASVRTPSKLGTTPPVVAQSSRDYWNKAHD